jgi:parvulin-like peptidyl-prolyl isomerase
MAIAPPRPNKDHRVRISPRPALIFTLVAALFTSACAAAGSSGVPATAAATVGDATISVDLLERVVGAAKENPSAGLAGLEGDELAEQTATLERDVLTALIRFELARQALDDRDVEVTDEAIDEEYGNQVDLAGGQEALDEQVTSLGLTDEEYRDLLVGNVVRERLLREAILGDNEVTDEQIQTVYEQRKESGQYEVGTVSHILVETEEEATEVIGLLEEGGDFAALAEERSQDPGSAAQGGTLPEAPFSNYVEEFAAAAREAEIGAIVGPVQTQFGFHIIRVDDRREIELDEVEDTLREELVGQQGEAAFQEELQSLFAEADVSVNSRFGAWDPATGAVVADTPTEN